jgi:hypothetical protein
MGEPVEFLPEITLSRQEALDVIARCEEAAAAAMAAGALEAAFAIEGVGRFLVGRLTGHPGGLDD